MTGWRILVNFHFEARRSVVRIKRCQWMMLCMDKRQSFNFGAGRGGIPYEKERDACRKFWIKPLKQTDLGVTKGSFYP